MRDAMLYLRKHSVAPLDASPSDEMTATMPTRRAM
jgi:hypothetical protein